MKTFITVTFMLICATVGISQNLITNSDFDKGKDVGYKYQKDDRSEAIIQIETDQNNGNNALKITTNRTNGKKQNLVITQALNSIRRGKCYKLSLTTKSSKHAKRLQLGIIGGRVQSFELAATNNYHTHNLMIKTLDKPNNTGEYNLSIEIPDDGQPCEWYLDDIKLTELTRPSQKNKYLSHAGSDDNDGTIISPFKTINYAVSTLSAGETLFIRKGTYHEMVHQKSFKGTKDQPITITNYNNEEVILNGTIDVDEIRQEDWKLHSPNIMTTTISADTWQLLEDNRWLINARWPNANFEDGSIWQHEESWARMSVSNKTITDIPHDGINLSSFPKDVTNATFVAESRLNLSTVTKHDLHSNTIEINKNIDDTKERYYLENHINLIDSKDEWFYDKETGKLYWWSENSSAPAHKLNCKIQDYFFEFTDCKYLNIKGLKFYGNSIWMEHASYSKLEDCDFEYPSCSRRKIGELGYRPTTLFHTNPRKTTYCEIINCTFRNTDSEAIKMYGNKNIINNCHFENIDHSTASLEHGAYAIYQKGDLCEFKNNTVINSASGNCLYGSDKAIVFNNFFNHCSHNGGDVGVIHLMIGAATDCNISYNWIFNSNAIGVRFDTPIPPRIWSHRGIIHHQITRNVARGLMVKGDYHQIYHNTCFNSKSRDITVLDEMAWVGNVTKNNAANELTGHRGKFRSISGIAEHNWNGYVTLQRVENQLRDISNLDFRPKEDSNGLIDKGVIINNQKYKHQGFAPDIGAYESGSENYWIPGRREEHATMPIPSDNGETNNESVDLMWRPGYQATGYYIYFGTSLTAVDQATDASVECKGQQVNNIYTPEKLNKNQTYYWRIDVISKNGIIKGQTWHFKSNKHANQKSLSDLQKESSLNDKITIYPNPANDYIQIKTNKTVQSISIYTVDGKQIKAYNNTDQHIDIRNLKRNVYLLKVNIDNVVHTQQFIKN
ncbi:T9SS type A sorting domain-containing protein [Halosquirtibacter xylanolyticus]|uniref:T9SS type A sorting domain-containing protein n=1 Tax=Halosquirtibacter xylanolyticus TaxID=3374599 RepID=UPI0037483E96|nr:T9SS type A sorting domain-containing protein [Prolixibacteraceae bacterium]